MSWSDTLVISGMSCSMTTIAAPVLSRMSSSTGPSASVSRCAMPDDGSSSSSTDGPCASVQARSTMRRVPVESSPTNLSAYACKRISSMSRSTSSSTAARTPAPPATAGTPPAGRAPRPCARRRWRSCRARSSTGTAGRPGTSGRARARARPCGETSVTSVPSSTTRPLVGVTKPEMMSSTVVLPAPLGPMRPTISPCRTRRSTPFTARTPPNDTLTSCSSRPT